MKDFAETLFNYLGDVIYDPSKATLDVERLPDEFRDLGAGLKLFADYVLETRDVAKALSKGQLNIDLPSPENAIAGPLKALHSSLKHLTWQAQQIAEGDYQQQVDYMGELGVAFNTMARSLEEYRALGLQERSKMQQYVELMMYNTPNLVLVFDTDCKNVLASESYIKISKMDSFEEIQGKSVTELFSEISTDEFMRTINKTIQEVLTNQTSVKMEQSLDFGDKNEPSIYNISLTPMISNDDSVIGTILIFEDITEVTRARQEAEEARMLAENASIVKSEFLALMSHEIRTPINAIIGMTELALRSQAVDEIHGNLSTVKYASSNLLSIIDDILDISKIESGKLEIVPEEYSFISLINDIVSIINAKLGEKPIIFTANIDPRIPRKIIGDYGRVKQIILNLLGNAVKYTKEGFISFSVTCETEEDNMLLKIEVSDSGSGIKEENVKYVFEKYRRFDTCKHQNVQGTGLGLPITKMLCETMGGEISVESEYGVGSVFAVKLPQKIVTGEKELAEVEDPNRKKVLLYEPRRVYASSIRRTLESLGVDCTHVMSRDDFWIAMKEQQHPYIFISSCLYKNDNGIKELSKKPEMKSKMIILSEHTETDFPSEIIYIPTPAFSFTIANALNNVVEKANKDVDNILTFVAPEARILIVDDIDINLSVAEGLMLPYEMQVETCKSGFEALNLVKKNRYDLIFMDHAMPEMDGIETTIKMRSIEDGEGYYQSVPIVALTANAVSGMREIFMQNGMCDFLSKPIDISRLNNVLKKWIPNEKQKESTESAFNILEEDTLKFEIEGLDTKLGLSLNGGVVKNYLKTLSVFCASVPEKIRELESSIENNNIELYTIIVHGLKNAAINIGAKKASDLARALEKAGRSEKTKFITDHSKILADDLSRLVQNVKDTLEKLEKTEVAEIDPGAVELLLESLNNVKNALDVMEITKAKNIIRELEVMEWNRDIRDLIAVLLQKILMFEYDEAIELICDFEEEVDAGMQDTDFANAS